MFLLSRKNRHFLKYLLTLLSRTRIYHIPMKNQRIPGLEFIYLGSIKVLQILSIYTSGESKYFRSWVYIPGENQSTPVPEYITCEESKYSRSWVYYLWRIKVLQVLSILPVENQSTSGPEHIYLGRIKVL